MSCNCALSLLRCAHRTSVSASTAVETGICINDVLAVTLRNRACRTCVCASTALDAGIRNSICHRFVPPVGISQPQCGSVAFIVAYFLKKASLFSYFLELAASNFFQILTEWIALPAEDANKSAFQRGCAW